MADHAFVTTVLRDADSSLAATFVPGAGMLCCSLCHHGEELLAQNAGVAAYAQRGKTMGIPLLYPWANRLAAFDYTAAGRTVTVPHDPARVAVDGNGLPIHGVVGGRLAWELDRPVHPDASSLAAHLRWDDSKPARFEVFPFRHDVHYHARLHDARLEVAIEVHACGADAVPVAFGFHPYLLLPGAPRERWLVELPPLRHLALDDRQIPTGPDRTWPAQSFPLAERQFDDGFDSVAQPTRFAVSAGPRRIALELLEGYPCAQVYAPRPSEFICFEPMTAPANALCGGAGLRVLAPGERLCARFAVSVLG